MPKRDYWKDYSNTNKNITTKKEIQLENTFALSWKSDEFENDKWYAQESESNKNKNDNTENNIEEKKQENEQRGTKHNEKNDDYNDKPYSFQRQVTTEKV